MTGFTNCRCDDCEETACPFISSPKHTFILEISKDDLERIRLFIEAEDLSIDEHDTEQLVKECFLLVTCGRGGELDLRESIKVSACGEGKV